jgi:hypothetical protein
MFKNALSLASAAVALFLVTAPAHAVGIPITSNDSYTNGAFHAAGASFTDTFDFQFGGYVGTVLASLSLSNNGTVGGLQTNVVPWITFTLQDSALQTVTNGSGTVLPGATGLFNAMGPLATGLYHLVISGTGGTPIGGLYSFTLTTGSASEAPATTPLPGALVLLGSVLFGGFGFAKFRRRRHTSNLALA